MTTLIEGIWLLSDFFILFKESSPLLFNSWYPQDSWTSFPLRSFTPIGTKSLCWGKPQAVFEGNSSAKRCGSGGGNYSHIYVMLVSLSIVNHQLLMQPYSHSLCTPQSKLSLNILISPIQLSFPLPIFIDTLSLI